MSHTWQAGDQGADLLYFGRNKPEFKLSDKALILYESETWTDMGSRIQNYPVFTLTSFLSAKGKHSIANFVHVNTTDPITDLPDESTIVWLLSSSNDHQLADLRRFILELMNQGRTQPVILLNRVNNQLRDEFLLGVSAEIGSILNDGLADGVWLRSAEIDAKDLNEISFGVLQASRSRMTKTEYIACPSCGRTLFDLEEVTAQIRERTSHLKGVKIGIMGCIVNGPGEMADADFGYVGSGREKIDLYVGKTCVERGIHYSGAVARLIQLIKDHDRWIEPQIEELIPK